MKAILIMILMFLSSGSYASSTSIQLIIDDSAMLQEREAAYQYKLSLLAHIKSLTKRREFANAHLDVIASSSARTIWSGKVSDLKKRADRASELIRLIKASNNRCNNLGGAFLELKNNLDALKYQGVSRAYVIIFSSMIDTPKPCKAIKSITLPQMPPHETNINHSLLSSGIVKDIRFYWISPYQLSVWRDYLAPVHDYAQSHDMKFYMYDITRSKPALESKSIFGGGYDR